MSNSKLAFLRTLLLSWMLALVGLAIVALCADHYHPGFACTSFERNFWDQHPEFERFDRVSSFFWSSLCASHPPPLVISASEGTVAPIFAAYLSDLGVHEFSGSHRGVKTLGYLAANKVHPDRLKNMKILAFINPVYFSFASTTDAASIQLNAISSLAYSWRVHSLKQKWDAFLLDSLFVGSKNYIEDLSLFLNPPQIPRPVVEAPPSEIPDSGFDPERNMWIGKTKVFTSYRSRFGKAEEPTRTLFNNALGFLERYPDVPICVVMLPINAKNLRYFHRDPEVIEREMRDLAEMIPAAKRLDLLAMSEDAKLFMDPMHFAPAGVAKIMQAVRASDCARPVLGGPPP